MLFIDSHCHLHDPRIRHCLPVFMQRAEDVEVAFMASCATMEENFDRTLSLAGEYTSVLPFFGIHPWFQDSRSEKWESVLTDYLLRIPSGVGETGLDFTDPGANRDVQITGFEFHLDLARQLKRPINIHIRKAWDTFIHILKKNGPLKVPGLIHSYSGSADMVPLFEKYNLYISFSGSITNPGARKVVSALKKVSFDRYVLETDTPDIYPYIDNPHPDRLNEPANIPQIAKIAAQRIGRTYNRFCERACENSRRLFEPIIQKKVL